MKMMDDGSTGSITFVSNATTAAAAPLRLFPPLACSTLSRQGRKGATRRSQEGRTRTTATGKERRPSSIVQIHDSKILSVFKKRQDDTMDRTPTGHFDHDHGQVDADASAGPIIYDYISHDSDRPDAFAPMLGSVFNRPLTSKFRIAVDDNGIEIGKGQIAAAAVDVSNFENMTEDLVLYAMDTSRQEQCATHFSFIPFPLPWTMSKLCDAMWPNLTMSKDGEEEWKMHLLPFPPIFPTDRLVYDQDGFRVLPPHLRQYLQSVSTQCPHSPLFSLLESLIYLELLNFETATEKTVLLPNNIPLVRKFTEHMSTALGAFVQAAGNLNSTSTCETLLFQKQYSCARLEYQVLKRKHAHMDQIFSDFPTKDSSDERNLFRDGSSQWCYSLRAYSTGGVATLLLKRCEEELSALILAYKKYLDDFCQSRKMILELLGTYTIHTDCASQTPENRVACIMTHTYTNNIRFERMFSIRRIILAQTRILNEDLAVVRREENVRKQEFETRQPWSSLHEVIARIQQQHPGQFTEPTPLTIESYSKDCLTADFQNLSQRLHDDQLAQIKKAEKKTCAICWVNGVTRVNIPCGHSVFCDECHGSFPEGGGCPLCRQPIANSLVEQPGGHHSFAGLCFLCEHQRSDTINTNCGHRSLCQDCAEPWGIRMLHEKCPYCGTEMTEVCNVFDSCGE